MRVECVCCEGAVHWDSHECIGVVTWVFIRDPSFYKFDLWNVLFY